MRLNYVSFKKVAFKKEMKVLIYAFREWALNVAKKLCELEEINIDIKVRDDNYSAIRSKNYDLIILIGWSDILPAELVSEVRNILECIHQISPPEAAALFRIRLTMA